MGEIVEATEATFGTATAVAGPVIVDFTGEWCEACRRQDPILRELAAELGDLRVVKVDVDDSPGIVRRFGVRAAPTLVFLRDGRERSRLVGVRRKDALLREIDALVASS